MPPRGVRTGGKRARQYEHIKESGRRRGMGNDRAEAMAARTVNKERSEAGESSRGSRKGGTRKRSAARKRTSGGTSSARPAASRKTAAAARKTKGTRKGARKTAARKATSRKTASTSRKSARTSSSGGRKASARTSGTRKRTAATRKSSARTRGAGRTVTPSDRGDEYGESATMMAADEEIDVDTAGEELDLGPMDDEDET
jgi:hypothetical protein